MTVIAARCGPSPGAQRPRPSAPSRTRPAAAPSRPASSSTKIPRAGSEVATGTKGCPPRENPPSRLGGGGGHPGVPGGTRGVPIPAVSISPWGYEPQGGGGACTGMRRAQRKRGGASLRVLAARRDQAALLGRTRTSQGRQGRQGRQDRQGRQGRQASKVGKTRQARKARQTRKARKARRAGRQDRQGRQRRQANHLAGVVEGGAPKVPQGQGKVKPLRSSMLHAPEAPGR